jgi:hypothetical protein
MTFADDDDGTVALACQMTSLRLGGSCSTRQQRHAVAANNPRKTAHICASTATRRRSKQPQENSTHMRVNSDTPSQQTTPGKQHTYACQQRHDKAEQSRDARCVAAPLLCPTYCCPSTIFRRLCQVRRSVTWRYTPAARAGVSTAVGGGGCAW